MPTAAKGPTTHRSPGATPASAPVRSRDEVGEARRLFENRLVHVSLRLPKTMTQMAEIEFDLSMQDLMTNVLASGDALAEVLKEVKSTETEMQASQPTQRLLRAMASAELINRGRFANTGEMFDALVEATRG